MKKLSNTIGLCLFSVGLGILLSAFIPDSILVCIEALLLIVAGVLIVI